MYTTIMLLSLLSAATLALVASSHGQELTCHSSRPAPLRVSVNSRQNQTGHWTSKVEMQHRGLMDVTGSTVDVEHNTWYCTELGETILNIALTFSAPPQLQQIQIPKGYEHFPGVGVYKFHTDVANWTTARQICEEERAHLVIINSEKEQHVVKTLFTAHPTIAGATSQDYAWVGVYRLAEEYFTVHGNTLASTGYVPWGRSQPLRTNNQYNCILAMRATAELADIICDWKVAFVCESNAHRFSK